MAVRQYEVIDHTQGKSKSMQFNMNAALKKYQSLAKRKLNSLQIRQVIV